MRFDLLSAARFEVGVRVRCCGGGGVAERSAPAGTCVSTAIYLRSKPSRTISDLHRGMSLWLGSNRCTLVFDKRRVVNVR